MSRTTEGTLQLNSCILQMYESEDVDANAFTGVPVFQAEGLIVKTDKAKYTPLFFNKEDLDAAVGNAYQERESHREATNKAHSSRAKADLEAAQQKVHMSRALV